MIFWERQTEREGERELPIHELVTAIFSFQNTIPSSAISGVFIKLIDKLVKESKANVTQDFIYWIRRIQINIGSETSQEDSLVYSSQFLPERNSKRTLWKIHKIIPNSTNEIKKKTFMWKEL